MSLFAFSWRALKKSICAVSSLSNNDDSETPASPSSRRPTISVAVVIVIRLSGKPVDSRVSTICRDRVSSSRWRLRRWRSLDVKGVSVEDGRRTRPSGCVIEACIIETETSRNESSDMASRNVC